jgi:hypothetical protein
VIDSFAQNAGEITNYFWSFVFVCFRLPPSQQKKTFVSSIIFSHSFFAMASIAIKLNNDAVAELKQGNLRKAFEYLCHASDKTTHSFSHAIHTGAKSNYFYRYHWEDCASALVSCSHLMPLQARHGGGNSFLCLRFLRISTPVMDERIGNCCPCGFAWVVYYK